MPHKRTISNSVITRDARNSAIRFFMGTPSSRKMERVHRHFDELDPGKREQDASQPVNQEVAAQKRPSAQRPEMHPAEGQGDERDDDEGVEDNGAQDGALGGNQPHDVERSA